MEPKLTFVADMWEGRNLWTGLGSEPFDLAKSDMYLPREKNEPEGSYHNRLRRSYFSRRFRQAIEQFSGYLSRFSMQTETPMTLQENIEDVDLRGNSLTMFLQGCNETALRDERCFVLVEFPRAERFANFAEERSAGFRPYLVRIDARNVINWVMIEDRLEQVTIRESVEVRDGNFGTKILTRFKVLYPGYYEVYEKDEDGKIFLIEPGAIETGLNEIPLMSYSLTGDVEFFTGDPPLYDLAELNLKLYQKVSEKDEIMHRCNMPILQLTEKYPSSAPDGLNPSLALTPSDCLWNLEAKFIEPTGAALSLTLTDIEGLESEITERTLSFLPTTTSRTATEVQLQAASSQAGLTNWARRIETNVHKIIYLWTAWTGEEPIGGINVVDELIKERMTEAQAQFLVGLAGGGFISSEELLVQLRDGGILSESLSRSRIGDG